MISKSDLKTLRNAIPYGGMKIIHQRFNEELKKAEKPELTYEYVKAVLNGIIFREDIIAAAINYVIEIKATEKKQSDRLSERIKQATA